MYKNIIFSDHLMEMCATASRTIINKFVNKSNLRQLNRIHFIKL